MGLELERKNRVIAKLTGPVGRTELLEQGSLECGKVKESEGRSH